ncbi:MAG: hypothetical protein LQ351_002041 [Letrouitia transgressa]|nr:MAG: hypothetical protein LQ351_002041 [Letrouitia transgressa]
MFPLSAILAFICLPCAYSQVPQYVLSNPSLPHTDRIPTIHESAIQARRILNLSSIATFSTVFPDDDDSVGVSENRPSGLGGVPIGLMEYYASCNPHPYDPTILAVTIATSIKNAHAGSNVTLSLRYQPPPDHPPGKDQFTYSPANLPRFSLVGHVVRVSENEARNTGIDNCFMQRHPEVIWQPGNDIHESWWAKLVVEEVYWFGGFGDRAYIGWIPVEEWRGVTQEEVAQARLRGEHGFQEKDDGYPTSWLRSHKLRGKR